MKLSKPADCMLHLASVSDFITAFTVGKATLAGASLVGLGALCYYGLGLSNDVGAIDRAAYVFVTKILLSLLFTTSECVSLFSFYFTLSSVHFSSAL